MGDFEERLWHASNERRIFTLERLPTLLAQGGDLDGAHRVLTDYGFLQAKVREIGVRALLDDYDTILEGRFGVSGALKPPQREDLFTLLYAIRGATHVLAEDPRQLASQLWGRIPRGSHARLDELLDEAHRRNVGLWLRPIANSLAVASESLVQTMPGDLSYPDALAVTGDGRLVIAAGARKIKVWDLDSGEELRTLEGFPGHLRALAVTPDGRHVIAVCGTGAAETGLRATVWDLECGDKLWSFEERADVQCAAITHDGKYVLSGDLSNRVKVWDLVTGKLLRTLKVPGPSLGNLEMLLVAPDNRHLITALKDETLHLWDLISGVWIRRFEGGSGPSTALAVTPDGRRLVSASCGSQKGNYEAQKFKIWDLESGNELRTFEGFSAPVEALAVTSDGRRLAVGSAMDRNLRIWDLESGNELRTFEGHSDWVRALAVTPDGRRVISASNDGTVKVWNVESGSGRPPLEPCPGPVCALAVTPDGRWAISATDDGALKMWIKIWDVESGDEIRRLLEGSNRFGTIGALAVTPDGRLLVSTSGNHRMTMWDLESGHEVAETFAHWHFLVTDVATTPDGSHLISASAGGEISVWHLASGGPDLVRTLEGHRSSVAALTVTPDGRRVISASNDRTLKVWDLGSGNELCRLEGHSGAVRSVAVTPNGQFAISASDDRTLKVWDLESGNELCTFEGHSGAIRSVAVTPNGQCVISVSEDRTLRVLDLESESLLASFRDEAALHCVCISPSGRTILAGGETGRVHFLRLEGARD